MESWTLRAPSGFPQPSSEKLLQARFRAAGASSLPPGDMGGPLNTSPWTRMTSIAFRRETTSSFKRRRAPSEFPGSTESFASKGFRLVCGRGGQVDSHIGGTRGAVTKNFALFLQRECDGDGGINFLGHAIDQHRLIAPLTDGLKRCLRQQIVSRQNLNLRDFALLVDHRMKDNFSLDASCHGLRGIFRLRLSDDGGRRHIAWDDCACGWSF